LQRFSCFSFFVGSFAHVGKVEHKLPTNSLTGGACDLRRRWGRSPYSVAPKSISMTFIPKRSVTSLEVLRCTVTGKPSFFHAARPPSRAQTFEMPIFCKATATRALVNTPEEEQYKIIPAFSGTTTRIRLRRRASRAGCYRRSIEFRRGARGPCGYSRSCNRESHTQGMRVYWNPRFQPAAE
jgi:hypothetical protein